MTIELKQVDYPKADNSGEVVFLSDETMAQRKEKVLNAMRKEQIDTLVIYNDLEHGANFSYLTGFVTRFEEGLLILHQTGQAFLILGNENTKMVNYSRIDAQLIHCPLFSLPDQPMDGERSLKEIFYEAGLRAGSSVGLVGWKMFHSHLENNRILTELPSFIVSQLQSVIEKGKIENRSDLFIHSDYGVRATNNSNEIAYYEFGSSLASDNVLRTIEEIEVGKSEIELANSLLTYGQNPTVVPIVATGERFQKANLYPSNKQVQLGGKMSITVGYKGGLASRSGYAVAKQQDLPTEQQNYLEKVAGPYFGAVAMWLETIDIGVAGKELYQAIEKVLPKSVYGWHLNPGHLTADEEWMSSPIKENSDIRLKSGMLLQIDIIPSVAGYAGASCENGIALADAQLRKDIEEKYPELWTRIATRRKYIKDVLGIFLPEAVLPLSSGVAFYNPFFLNRTIAFTKK